VTTNTPNRFDILLRVGGFATVVFVVLILSSGLMIRLDDLTRSALAHFAAGLAANLFLTRKFERGQPSDFGFAGGPASAVYLAGGFLIGAGAVSLLILTSVLTGLAEFTASTPDRSIAPLGALLFAGVLGEEMIFRGYAFQYLIRWRNQPLIIIGSAALFGFAHLANGNVQFLGVANTVLWGCLLGYAYARARTLWLPSGIHFGWNLALVAFTSNMSGITIRATAWDLQWSAGDLWSGGSYGLEGGLLTTIVVVPVFLLVRRAR
jgi:membrane protease YdiL (CAAX protease family)